MRTTPLIFLIVLFRILNNNMLQFPLLKGLRNLFLEKGRKQ